MIKYTINLGNGKGDIAEFWCGDKYDHAPLAYISWAMGWLTDIWGDPLPKKITKEERDVEVPEQIAKQGDGNYFLLVYNNKYVVFDADFSEGDVPWRVADHRGNVCRCTKRGMEELKCEIHHYGVKNHDDVCKDPKCRELPF